MEICQYLECNNPVFSNHYCKHHQHYRTDEKYLKAKDKAKKHIIPQPTGEGALFQAILAVRPHVDFVTGEPIPNASYYNCHHVLKKSSYPKFRLFDKNIVLLTNDNHDAIESLALSDMIAEDDRWQKYADKFNELKQLYYK